MVIVRHIDNILLLLKSLMHTFTHRR